MQTGDGAQRDVEGATRAAMQILSALSDAAISGGKLSSEMSNANASTAKCQPWSRPDYLSRLASFSPMTWFNKPVTSTFWQRSRTLRGCGMVVLATTHAHVAKRATATCASFCVGTGGACPSPSLPLAIRASKIMPPMLIPMPAGQFPVLNVRDTAGGTTATTASAATGTLSDVLCCPIHRREPNYALSATCQQLQGTSDRLDTFFFERSFQGKVSPALSPILRPRLCTRGAS